MSEMLTGPKKIVDGLTEVFRGLTRMCEGMAEQIELLEFTSEDAEDEDIHSFWRESRNSSGRSMNPMHGSIPGTRSSTSCRRERMSRASVSIPAAHPTRWSAPSSTATRCWHP